MTEPTGTGTAKQMFVDTYKPHRIGLHSDDKPYIGEPLCYCDKPMTAIKNQLFPTSGKNKTTSDPTLLDSEIKQILDYIEGDTVDYNVQKYMGKAAQAIKALIATIGNEVIGQDAWGCYQHPQPNDGCSSESCEAGIHINEKLATQRSRLQELINGR